MRESFSSKKVSYKPVTLVKQDSVARGALSYHVFSKRETCYNVIYFINS